MASSTTDEGVAATPAAVTSSDGKPAVLIIGGLGKILYRRLNHWATTVIYIL